MQTTQVEQRPGNRIPQIVPQQPAHNASRHAEPAGHAAGRVLQLARSLTILNDGAVEVREVIEMAVRDMPRGPADRRDHRRECAYRALNALLDEGHLLVADGRVRLPLPLAA